jgi:hypothetical protein
MSEDASIPPQKKRRIDLFFPLLLIAIGVIFLLSNLGIISGDAWTLIWQFWPLLLIVIGLDNIFKREGLVSATFLIGIGIIFLLANLGYLNVSVWQMVFTLWPILLIAIGFDILFGRRSLWLSLIGVVLILVILVGSLSLFGVAAAGGSTVTGDHISQGLNGATQANVSIEPGAGNLQVKSLSEPELLIEGFVPPEGESFIKSSYTVTNGTGTYKLSSNQAVFLPSMGSTNKLSWNLNLTDQVPLDLQLILGAGSLNADLSALNLDSLQVNMGVGTSTITLPKEGSLQAQVDGAIGQMKILVPEGMEVLIQANTALSGMSVPDGYVHTGDVYKSPGYDQSDQRTNLSLDMAIGNVIVQEMP